MALPCGITQSLSHSRHNAATLSVGCCSRPFSGRSPGSKVVTGELAAHYHVASNRQLLVEEAEPSRESDLSHVWEQPMRTRHAFVLIAVTVYCSAGIAAADALVSGPQAGRRLPDNLHPLNITNAEKPSYAGTKTDYTEQFGADPVVLVFARAITDPLTNLMKKLDAEVGKHKAVRLKAVVVLLSDDDKLERTLG